MVRHCSSIDHSSIFELTYKPALPFQFQLLWGWALHCVSFRIFWLAGCWVMNRIKKLLFPFSNIYNRKYIFPNKKIPKWLCKIIWKWRNYLLSAIEWANSVPVFWRGHSIFFHVFEKVVTRAIVMVQSQNLNVMIKLLEFFWRLH